MVNQCLEKLKTVGGPVDSNPKEIKAGEGIGHYEAPRGECFHYIRSDGTNRPVRHKVRAPSFMNVITDREAVLGQTIADATIILAAVDPCYCCTERMAVIDPASGRQLMSPADLLRLSHEKTERLKKDLGKEGPNLNWNS
jgi:membrane-bound hydrogenase subunit alpha